MSENIYKRKNVSCHDFVKICSKVLANVINQGEKLIFFKERSKISIFIDRLLYIKIYF